MKLFEIGSISNYNKNTYNRSLESRKLGICYLGDKINTWRYKAAVDIVSVKTDVYNIFKNLGFNNIVFKVISKNSSNNDIEVMIGNKSGAFKKAGNIFILNKDILNYFTIKSSVIIVDLDIDLINKLFSKSLSYEKPSQYPSSSRDISSSPPSATIASRPSLILDEDLNKRFFNLVKKDNGF